MPERLDEFGRYVLAEGIVTPAVLEDCLAAQGKLREVGIEKSFAEVLVDKGVIDRKEVRRLTAKMKGGDEDFIPGYRILKKLGDGAMGRVYQAVQIATERIVALKILYPRFAREERFTKMFQREAGAALQLSHKNLVQGYDAGVVRDRYFYYAMEFVEGTNLRKRYLTLRERASEYDCLTVLMQMGQALEYAHQFKFVHRDIKPDNIIITNENVIKLCDLGLIKQMDDTLSLTQTGLVVGTPYYISPEQGRGRKDLDIRSDMYSLGATIYHIATLHVPFDGEEPLAVIERHCRDALVPPHELRPELSRGFSYVLVRMMAKDREDRYADPSALIADVERVMRGKDPSPEKFRAEGAAGSGSKEAPAVRGAAAPARRRPGSRSSGAGSRTMAAGRPPRAAAWLLAGLGAIGAGTVAWAFLSGSGEPIEVEAKADPPGAGRTDPPPRKPDPKPEPPPDRPTRPDPDPVRRPDPTPRPPEDGRPTIVRVPDGGRETRPQDPTALLTLVAGTLEALGIATTSGEDGGPRLSVEGRFPGAGGAFEKVGADGRGGPLDPASIGPGGLALNGGVRATVALTGAASVEIDVAPEGPISARSEPLSISVLLMPHLVSIAFHPDGRAEASLRFHDGYAGMAGEDPGPYGAWSRPLEASPVDLPAAARFGLRVERSEGGDLSVVWRPEGGSDTELAFWIPDVRGEDRVEWPEDRYFPLATAAGGVRVLRLAAQGDPLRRWLERLAGDQ